MFRTPAKRNGMLGVGSVGFGAPGRRVSAGGRFKTPFRKNVESMAGKTSLTLTSACQGKEVLSSPLPILAGVTPGDTVDQHDHHQPDSLDEVVDSDEEEGMLESRHDIMAEIFLLTFFACSVVAPEPLPVEVEDTLCNVPNVDAPFSKKFELDERNKGLKELLRALRRTFLEDFNCEALWGVLNADKRNKNGFSEVERCAFLFSVSMRLTEPIIHVSAQLVLDCSVRLEYNAMTYAVGIQRYKQNIKSRKRAILGLASTHAAKDEIQGEIFKEMRRVCSWMT
jgi:hypothetical protein